MLSESSASSQVAADERGAHSASKSARLKGLVAVYAVFFAATYMHIRLWQSENYLSPENAQPVAEAEAWLNGHVDLPKRLPDTALVDGKVYNVFPPMMTFIAAACLPWSPTGIPVPVISALFVLPIPGLAYLLFLRRCRTVAAAVVMALTYTLGTSQFSIMTKILRSSDVWQLNNAVTQLGLLIFLIDYYGRRRFAVGGIGLIIMGWARQTMFAYLIPYFWGLWTRSPRGKSAFGGIAIACFALAVPAIVTTVRFGHPTRISYAKIYEGRVDDPNDWLAHDGSEALFSPRYVPRNLYWMNIGPPEFKYARAIERWRWMPSAKSTGIWWTTPVLFYLLFDGLRIWRDRPQRPLIGAVGLVFNALMLYHNMGYAQRGYNRFSLDFMLPLLAMIAPFAMEGRRRYLTIAMGLWSAYYFRFIL